MNVKDQFVFMFGLLSEGAHTMPMTRVLSDRIGAHLQAMDEEARKPLVQELQALVAGEPYAHLACELCGIPQPQV